MYMYISDLEADALVFSARVDISIFLIEIDILVLLGRYICIIETYICVLDVFININFVTYMVLL